MKLRKPTTWKRRTVDQTGRIIVMPEDGQPIDALRYVTIAIPEGPPVVVALGPTDEFEGETVDDVKLYLNKLRNQGGILGIDDAGAFPADIAEGRVYQWPEPDPGATYCFHIRADQWIAAAAVKEHAKITVITEYVEDRKV